MAVKNYQWTAALSVSSGGYEGELISIKKDGVTLYSGSIGPHSKIINLPWTTTSDTDGDETYTYSYRDSDHMDNNNSTEVEVTVKDVWHVDIDSYNVMTVTITTTLISAVRIKHGSITNANRHLWMRRSSSGSDFSPFPLIDNATTAHTIASNVSLGQYVFTLQPGENATRASIWWRSTMVGHESDPIPNIYTDILGIGIHFKNILPKETIPGKIYSGNGHWLSHNRETNGHAKLYYNSAWGPDMKNVDGGTGTGDPPIIKHNDGWKNMRTIGEQA